MNVSVVAAAKVSTDRKVWPLLGYPYSFSAPAAAADRRRPAGGGRAAAPATTRAGRRRAADRDARAARAARGSRASATAVDQGGHAAQPLALLRPGRRRTGGGGGGRRRSRSCAWWRSGRRRSTARRPPAGGQPGDRTTRGLAVGVGALSDVTLQPRHPVGVAATPTYVTWARTTRPSGAPVATLVDYDANAGGAATAGMTTTTSATTTVLRVRRRPRRRERPTTVGLRDDGFDGSFTVAVARRRPAA